MLVFIGMETSGELRRRFQAQGHHVISCDILPSEDETDASLMVAIGSGGHIRGDVFETLDRLRELGWWPDLAVFHPTCTYHTLSAAWAFNDPDYERYPGVGYHQKVKPGTLTGAARREAREMAEADVERIKRLPIKVKVIENPKGTIPTRTSLGKPVDVVQPYEFGDDASKGTCLWVFDEDGQPLPEMTIPRDPAKFVKPRLVCKECEGRNDYDAAFGHGCVHCGAEAGKLLPRWANQTDKNQNRLTPSDDRWKERSRTFPGIADAIAAKMGSAVTNHGSKSDLHPEKVTSAGGTNPRHKSDLHPDFVPIADDLFAWSVMRNTQQEQHE